MTPIGDRVVLKQFIEAATSEGGIVIPEIARAQLPEAEVLFVGPDVKQVKVGDIVVFNTYSKNRMTTDAGDVVVVDEIDILVILSEKAEPANAK